MVTYITKRDMKTKAWNKRAKEYMPKFSGLTGGLYGVLISWDFEA